MNILKLYEDYNLPIAPIGNSHRREGWINTHCFCRGSKDYHLGYNISKDYFYCWRCGWHSTLETLKNLLGLNRKELIYTLKKYKGDSKYQKQKIVPKIQSKTLVMPNNVTPLTDLHRKYLESRKFNPDLLIKNWDVQSTSPISTVNGEFDYSNRILFPIIWNKEVVSYQTRAANNQKEMKYKNCRPEFEKLHFKDILYGKQEFWGETGICCEGILDVIRLGYSAFSTFGAQYSNKQLRIMTKNFDRIVILYDNDDAGNTSAEKLKKDLAFLKVDTIRIIPETDPAEMSKEDVVSFLKEFNIRR